MSQKNEVEFFVTIDGHYCIVLMLILTPFNIEKVNRKFVSACQLNYRTTFI